MEINGLVLFTIELMNKQQKPLAIEYWINDFIENLKKKTIVSISDLEEFNKKAMNLLVAIQDLRKSRDAWKDRYRELIKKLSQNGLKCV